MTHPQRRTSFTHCAAVTACFLLLAPGLAAQNSGRGFIKAQAGATLGGAGTGLAAGGGFGVRITEYLDLFAEAGTIDNVCEYGFFGSRITLPVRSVITPFFEFGGGAGRLAPNLRTERPGIGKARHIQQGISGPADTNFMLTASGGIHLAATRRFGFDFAYRYFRISTVHSIIGSSQVYAGIVFRF